MVETQSKREMIRVTTEREMGGHRRHNIMAVDLAIQRELAYRKKVVMLGLEPFDDSGWKEFLPLQVVPSSSTISRLNPDSPSPSPNLIFNVPELKQNASSSSLQRPVSHPVSIPAPNPIQKPWLSSSLSPHATGMKREAPTAVSIPRCLTPRQQQPISSGGNIPKSRTDNFFCNVCQVSCSGSQNFKMHIKGRQHMAKLKELKLGGKESGEKANQPPRCELCKIWCTDEFSLRLHLDGQKHRAKLQKLEVGGGNDGVENAKQRQWCNLCKIWCMDESAFKQHNVGKKHLLNLYTLKEKEGCSSGRGSSR